MRKLKYTLILVAMFVSIKITKAQPSNDPAWILQPNTTYGGTEEFNATLDFTNKWHPMYPWGDYKGQAEINYPANLIQTTGTTLKIKADTLYPPVRKYNPQYSIASDDSVTVVYQGGNLQSRRNLSGNDIYKFGYLEIYAKLPQDSVYPLWPAFWLWSADSDCDSLKYDEIDICENGAGQSYWGNVMGTNWHIFAYGDCDSNANTDNGLDINNLPILHDAFHKYAIEWGPDRMIYYFDDMPVRTNYDPTGVTVTQNPMAVILNFAIDTWNCYLPSNWNVGTSFPKSNTNYPQYFEIDYLRYYKLNATPTTCGTNLTICTPSTDYGSRAVEKTIKTGGVCSPTFNGSSISNSYTLRATDYVLIDAGTTIEPSGSGYFSTEILVCPNY
ncbi:MAG: glycoside hydrolase family 16 protein [Bacteroidota bacterium]